MAPASKVVDFHKEGNDWYCSAGLPSDITVVVDGVNFYLHKFPLVSRCGKIARACEKSLEKVVTTSFEEFPCGPEIFLIVVKFCYGICVDFAPDNIVAVYCAADYLEMTEEYGEDNLVPRSASFFQENVLCCWKDCILAFQSCDSVMATAENLRIISKCLNSLSTMACTDPSLFGWPMKMYGSLQSPGGSILWNGINTGARIRSVESDWWFEDASHLSVGLFERLISTMQTRGVRAINLAGGIMYYARKHIPGLDRWSKRSGKVSTISDLSSTHDSMDRIVVLETVEKLLPVKKGKSFCRFLLGLLRLSLMLNASQTCMDSLERRIGVQLEMATLDGLLIPSYSDSDTLYDVDCVERIVRHFISSESTITQFSPASQDLENSPSFSEPFRKVTKLIDDYLAEVASDVNLKPIKLRSLVEAFPDSSRPLHDGLYRSFDIYFQAHPWLSEKEREELCNIIDYQKLSIDALAHASLNERLPLRVILQVLYFEQLQLRTALASYLQVLDPETGPITVPSDMAGQIVERDGWVKVVRDNRVFKGDMMHMRARVVELEDEFSRIKRDMKRVSKSHSYISSPRFMVRKMGCKLLPLSTDTQPDVIESTGPTPRASVEQARHSIHSRHNCRES